jgi:hypothetical protein
MTASAPVALHDAASSPRTTAVRSVAPNAITPSASTRAKTGSTVLTELRTARASPT